MKKYYLMAIDKDNIDAMSLLGYYYETIEKDYKQMKKYYLMAIDKEDTYAMGALGNYYQTIEKDYNRMKKYYLMAIDKDDINSMISLGDYYNDIENYKLMKKYYLMAINKGETKAMYELGSYYYNNDDTINMIKYYSMAIENNIEDNREEIIIVLANIIEDIGSGLNLNKRGINKIIHLGIKGKINELVVAYKDRLTRFGFELIEEIITKYSNGTIKILNNKTEISQEE